MGFGGGMAGGGGRKQLCASQKPLNVYNKFIVNKRLNSRENLEFVWNFSLLDTTRFTWKRILFQK